MKNATKSLLTEVRKPESDEINWDLAKEAILAGADVNAKRKNGWTVLMYTAFEGHLEVANLLLEKGSDKYRS